MVLASSKTRHADLLGCSLLSVLYVLGERIFASTNSRIEMLIRPRGAANFGESGHPASKMKDVRGQDRSAACFTDSVAGLVVVLEGQGWAEYRRPRSLRS